MTTCHAASRVPLHSSLYIYRARYAYYGKSRVTPRDTKLENRIIREISRVGIAGDSGNTTGAGQSMAGTAYPKKKKFAFGLGPLT